MQRSPKREKTRISRRAEREEKRTSDSTKHEERQSRLPIQAAPVRRTENPPGPFSPETAPEAICHILSPHAALRCIAARGISQS